MGIKGQVGIVVGVKPCREQAKMKKGAGNMEML